MSGEGGEAIGWEVAALARKACRSLIILQLAVLILLPYNNSYGSLIGRKVIEFYCTSAIYSVSVVCIFLYPQYLAYWVEACSSTTVEN